ncbi:MAG: hypothetical protein HND57_16955 [Planctomycetes bacterium]|nr:hypothetical protein [Planctomycetota bacterium]
MLLRLLVDTLVVAGLALLCLGYLAYERGLDDERRQIEDLRTNVRLIEQQVKLQAALGHAQCNEDGFPVTVNPAWFGTAIPRNPMLNDGRHPWVEVAFGPELTAEHPHLLVASRPELAGFWYNPRTGTVRARVPQMVSDEHTLEVYNYVNGCNLSKLFVHDLEPVTAD